MDILIKEAVYLGIKDAKEDLLECYTVGSLDYKESSIYIRIIDRLKKSKILKKGE